MGFFFGRRSSMGDVLFVLYLWAAKANRGMIKVQTGLHHNTISHILSDWYQMIQEDLIREDCQIGGVNEDGSPIVVEIDESKFGKRKYHRGHRVEGVWVVGGVENTPARKCFLVIVPDRTERTLLSIIEQYVKPGSIVRTDCWRAYTNMVNLGLQLTHQTVNHSVSFRDGDVHTNTIEGTWNGVKLNVSPRLRTRQTHLQESPDIMAIKYIVKKYLLGVDNIY